MAHIPPKRGVDEEDSTPTEGSESITIEGKDNSIEIKLPKFYPVYTSMSINLTGDMGEAKVVSKSAQTTGEKSFKSEITRIVLYGVRGGSVAGEFIPNASGNCTIKIFFKHLP